MLLKECEQYIPGLVLDSRLEVHSCDVREVSLYLPLKPDALDWSVFLFKPHFEPHFHFKCEEAIVKLPPIPFMPISIILDQVILPLPQSHERDPSPHKISLFQDFRGQIQIFVFLGSEHVPFFKPVLLLLTVVLVDKYLTDLVLRHLLFSVLKR